MTDPAPPTVRYVLQADHLVHAMLHGTADAQRRVRVRYALYSVALTVVWALIHPYSTGATPFLLLYGAVVFAGLALFRPWMVRRQVERLVAGRADIGQPIELRVTTDAFQVDIAGVFRSSQVLRTLHAAAPGPEGTLIQPFPNEFLWVPAAVFDSADARARFDNALLAGLRIPDPAL